MKILQVCYKMPYPLKDGGEYSIYNSALSLLKQPNVSLKVVAINPTLNFVNQDMLPNTYLKATRFESIQVNTKVRLFPLMINIFSKHSYFVQRFYSKVFEKKLIQIIETETYDIILLEHLYLCLYIDAIHPIFKGNIILRAQNVEFEIWNSYLKNKARFFEKFYISLAAKRLTQFELTQLNKVDGIINLTEKDNQTYKNLGLLKPSTVVPIGFDFEKLFRSEIANTAVPSELKIYHLGSMDWRPNEQAIKWFIEHILPLLVKKIPTIQIHLAGKKMPKWIYDLENKNLIVDGEVENAWEYQKDKSILIVPLLSGSGIRVKIIEALALGKVVISTQIGAQGIPNSNNTILIADDPEMFVQHLLNCINSIELRKKLSEQSSQLAQQHFDLKKVGEQTIDFFKSL